MYPNSALSAWQLAVMAVVPVMALAAWLTAVYLAARDTGGAQAGDGWFIPGISRRREGLPFVAPEAGARAAAGRPCGRIARRPDDTAAIRPPGFLHHRPEAPG
jgi:hypothetical protein